MKFDVQVDNKMYRIDTQIMVKDESGVSRWIQTIGVLGDRFVQSYGLDDDGKNQIVQLGSKSQGGFFTRPLIKNGGKDIVVVLDRKLGIINPYLSINNWAVRSSTIKNGVVEITSSKFPGNIDHLPDSIPILDRGTLSPHNLEARNSSTATQHTSDRGMIVAASFIASWIGNKGIRSGNHTRKMLDRRTYSADKYDLVRNLRQYTG
jgi:hypothetical protein